MVRYDGIEVSDYWSPGSDSPNITSFQHAIKVLEGRQGGELAIYDESGMDRGPFRESERYVIEYEGEVEDKAGSIKEVNEVLESLEEEKKEDNRVMQPEPTNKAY